MCAAHFVPGVLMREECNFKCVSYRVYAVGGLGCTLLVRSLVGIYRLRAMLMPSGRFGMIIYSTAIIDEQVFQVADYGFYYSSIVLMNYSTSRSGYVVSRSFN